MSRSSQSRRSLPATLTALALLAGCATVDEATPTGIATRELDGGHAAATSAAAISSQQTLPAQERSHLWTVTCGLPQQDNPLLALFPTGGYTGPWFGDLESGHLEVKMLTRPHPRSGISTEMWMLSRDIGWWRLKAIRMHPEDVPKFTGNAVENTSRSDIRQIIDSPFLSRPAIVRAGAPDDEELVNGQILALLPDAVRLRCAPESNE